MNVIHFIINYNNVITIEEKIMSFSWLTDSVLSNVIKLLNTLLFEKNTTIKSDIYNTMSGCTH